MKRLVNLCVVTIALSWIELGPARAQYAEPARNVAPAVLGALRDLQATSLPTRERAFYIIYNSLTSGMSSDLILNGGRPVDPAIKSGLISLLKLEARHMAKLDQEVAEHGGAAVQHGANTSIGESEAYSDYWQAVTEVVGELRDPQALEILLDPTVLADGSYNVALIAEFGPAILPRLISLYRQPRYRDAQTDLSAIMLALLKSKRVASEADRAAIRSIFLEQSYSGDASVRISAVVGLAYFHDADAVARLKALAQHDEFALPLKNGQQFYTVRVSAGHALAENGLK